MLSLGLSHLAESEHHDRVHRAELRNRSNLQRRALTTAPAVEPALLPAPTAVSSIPGWWRVLERGTCLDTAPAQERSLTGRAGGDAVVRR